ncbi:polyprenyl synthetase family protein [Pseudomonas sp. RIT-PI-S]|uniref:polyprenyl synthetase family protein n=1 Tax=Pseudomonas sp. RIT-PI-S TaxID=3035295 RepID=UPI0021DA0803|nr:polyprenyl synthetase family protein [Pseudomonas sp. RIT-PI-S]
MTAKPFAVLEDRRRCDWGPLRQSVEDRLHALLPEPGDHQQLLELAMRESALAPGKRVRPLLLLLAAEGLGETRPGVLDMACAVEMVHAASLVLDDLPCMDNATLRRGLPALHLRVGQDVAILAAIALLSRAFGLLASADIEAPRKALLGAELSRAVGSQGLVRGQYEDLREGSLSRSPEAIARTNELKTAVLFDASLQMAAIVAGAQPWVRQALGAFALDLGQAFQLLDDLHDQGPATPALGKDVGKDAGKSTLVAVLGQGGVKHRLRQHLRSAEQHLAKVYRPQQPIRLFVAELFSQFS